MNKLFLYILFLAVSNSVYSQKLSSPVDKKATKETKALFKNLKSLMGKGILFGHQDDPAYGVTWKYESGRSDIKDMIGDYPALYGFELGRLELDHAVNLDSVPFDSARKYIEQAYARGGVITISWHLNNPLTGEVAWAPEPGRAVASVLPGGEKNALYKTWLDKVATFILSLKGKHGEQIPIIFRPFHELNGNWFWWGKDHCTPQEFEKLWHFTVSYLKDKKNIHQMLYAYGTDKFSSKEEWLTKYPGNDWVDIIGFDSYQRKSGAEGNDDYIKTMDNMLTMLGEIALEKNKIPALTEFGYSEIPDSTWWTNVLYKALGHHKIAFMLAWRNAGYKSPTETEYYVPYKGQASEKDFIKFSKKSNILFQKSINYKRIYR